MIHYVPVSIFSLINSEKNYKWNQRPQLQEENSPPALTNNNYDLVQYLLDHWNQVEQVVEFKLNFLFLREIETCFISLSNQQTQPSKFCSFCVGGGGLEEDNLQDS